MPNHACSSVREEGMESPSVRSENSRCLFFQRSIDGVGTPGSSCRTGISAGEGGGNAFAGESFVYRLFRHIVSSEMGGVQVRYIPRLNVIWNFTRGAPVVDSDDSMTGVVLCGGAMDISSPISI